MPDTDPVADLRGPDGALDPVLVAKEMRDWHRWEGRMDVFLADDLPPQVAGPIKRYVHHEASARFAILRAENERLRGELTKCVLREDIMREALREIRQTTRSADVYILASHALDAVERRTETAAAEVTP